MTTAKKTATKKVPAKKTAVKKKAIQKKGPPFGVGDSVTFKGYSDTSDMTEDEILFTEGEALTVEVVTKDGSEYAIYVRSDEDPNKEGTVWAEELAPGEDAEEQEEGNESPYGNVTAVIDNREPGTGAKAKGKTAKAKNAKGKTAKAKTAKAAKPEPEPFIVTPALAKQLGKGTDEEKQDKALELVTTKEASARRTEYQLMCLIAFIYASKAYTRLQDDKGVNFPEGRAGFMAYCDTRLKTGYRKAMHLVEVYEKAAKFGLTEEQFAAVGWSKMVDVARVSNTEKQFSDWTAKAEKLTQGVLKEQVTKKLVEQGKAPKQRGPQSEVTRFPAVVVSNTDAKNIEKAVAEAKKVLWEEGTPEPSFGACINHICSEWLTLE